MTKLPRTSVELDDDGQQLLALIRNRISQGKPMADIARELGVSVDALCRFCMNYKEPRHVVRYQGKTSPALAISASPMIHDHWSLPADARRFATWRKAKAGAIAARNAS